MGAALDLANQKFGRLTVIKKTNKRQNNSIIWECICDCGNICEVNSSNLKRGKVQSCGCLKKESDRKPKGNVINMLDKTFGHLKVIERDGSDERGEAKWLCQCDCGKSIISVLGSNLRTGHTTSCGCERRSKGEIKVAELLTKNGIPFKQEYSPFKFTNGKNATFDFFVNNKYYIEYDGETHYNYNLHGWHTKEQLQAQQERDMIKNQWCKENNIPLIRIPYTHYNDLKIEDLILESSKYIKVAE